MNQSNYIYIYIIFILLSFDISKYKLISQLIIYKYLLDYVIVIFINTKLPKRI